VQASFVVCSVFYCNVVVGNDSDVTQKPKEAGVGVGAAAEQGDASNFTAFHGILQVKIFHFDLSLVRILE